MNGERPAITITITTILTTMLTDPPTGTTITMAAITAVPVITDHMEELEVGPVTILLREHITVVVTQMAHMAVLLPERPITLIQTVTLLRSESRRHTAHGAGLL